MYVCIYILLKWKMIKAKAIHYTAIYLVNTYQIKIKT